MIDGREHGLQTVGPGRGAEHQIDVGVGRNLHETVPARPHESSLWQRSEPLQAIERLGRRHRNGPRLISCDLAGEAFGISTRREADDTKSIGESVDDGERTLTDGASGPENGDAFHNSAFSFKLSALSSQLHSYYSQRVNVVLCPALDYQRERLHYS